MDFDEFLGLRADGPRRGADLRVDITLTLEEAAAGCRRTVELVRDEPCAPCKSSGLVGTVRDCGTCNGTGKVLHAQGFFNIQTVCGANDRR